MTSIKVNVDTSVLEEKLKIAHKHIGSMLQELQLVCNDCGSSNTKIQTTNSDKEILYKVKICRECDFSEVIEAVPTP